jgi:hypothetical protein
MFFTIFKQNFKNYVFLVPFFALTAFILINGCGSDPTNPPTTIDNPNVKSFDSVGIDEDSSLDSYSGINLVNGTTVKTVDASRDVSLADNASLGLEFYLRTGTLDHLLPAGYETRFFQVKSDLSASDFDTMSAVYDNIGSAFDTTDFTQDNTSFWGYFQAPLLTHPVYCFWLKGKRDAGLTTKSYYGIIQPRESTDKSPGAPYGYRMSFRYRININGENDFRKKITQ